MTIWASRLMLAALLCLDAWLVSRVACDWPHVSAGPSLQAYPVDVASVFGAR